MKASMNKSSKFTVNNSMKLFCHLFPWRPSYVIHAIELGACSFSLYHKSQIVLIKTFIFLGVKII